MTTLADLKGLWLEGLRSSQSQTGGKLGSDHFPPPHSAGPSACSAPVSSPCLFRTEVSLPWISGSYIARKVGTFDLTCVYFVSFTTYGPHSLRQVKKLFWASIPFSINGGNWCADSENMSRMCVVGPDSQRNSPHVPTLLLSLASGSVLTHEQPRVLTQPSAFLIEICLLMLSVILSGLHSRAGLVFSVKLGCECLDGWDHFNALTVQKGSWKCRASTWKNIPLILGKPGWGIFLGAICLELFK